MAQITATITDDVVKKIDLSATQKGISRSRWVALAIDSYLIAPEKSIEGKNRETEGTSGVTQDDTVQIHEHTVSDQDLFLEKEHMREEIQRLMHEAEGKNQVIKLQSDEIAWLRGECAKITDRMLIALPPPRQHWWEIWKQKT